MDEHEPLCAACGAACNAITGAQGQRWTLNTAHHTLTSTVHLSEYEAIAMGHGGTSAGGGGGAPRPSG